jgi:hypothetical protein
VFLEVALSAKGFRGVALCAVQGHSGEECSATYWHGMVILRDGLFPTSRTNPLSSIHSCHSRGKATPTLPVHRDDWL